MLDVVNIGDSVIWNTSTVLNRKESYCFHKKKDLYQTYLNLRFDIYEVFRRKFEGSCSKVALSRKISREEIFAEFNAMKDELLSTFEFIEMDLLLDKFEALKRWQSWADSELMVQEK